MCPLNSLCKIIDGTCNCSLLGPTNICKPVPAPLFSQMEFMVVNSLFMMISQQNDLILKIREDAKAIAEKTTRFNECVGTQASAKIEVTSEELTNSEKLLKSLCGEENNHLHFLQIKSDLPRPAYKDRSFSILLQIVNAKGENITLPSAVGFTIMLFTTESPPKALKVNTSGDKIMKGTIESEGCSMVCFKKVIIKEVTSHFRSGWIFLVIASIHPGNIRPLIIPNFIIKARKLSVRESPIKKMKLSE